VTSPANESVTAQDENAVQKQRKEDLISVKMRDRNIRKMRLVALDHTLIPIKNKRNFERDTLLIASWQMPMVLILARKVLSDFDR